MPTIKGLSHVVLYVNDLDKMVAFYRDVLGLVKYRENAGRMVFLTADPNIEDHQLALTKGREGNAKIGTNQGQTSDDAVHFVNNIQCESCIPAHSGDHVVQSRCCAARKQDHALVGECRQWNLLVTRKRMTFR